MSEPIPIPKGALLTITSGEYSDYYVRGVFRAAESIDWMVLSTIWIEEHPDQAERYHFDESAFLAWVASKGFLEPIECWEWHLSDYAIIQNMSVEKMSADIP